MDQIPAIDFSIRQGDDEPITFEILPPDDSEISVDLSAYQFDMWVKPDKGATLKYSTKDGSIKVHNNTLNLRISSQDTWSSKWTQASYDVQMIDAEGFYTTIVEGTITLNHDVTQEVKRA